MAEDGDDRTALPGLPSALPPDLRKTLEKLPPEERASVQRQVIEYVQHTVTQVAFQGPYPPPDMVAEYERHHPGFLSELLARTRDAQVHIHRMDERELSGQFAYLNRGQFLGFLVALSGIGGAVACAYLGQPAIGVALGLAGLAPVIGHFLQNPFKGVLPSSQPKAPEKVPQKPLPKAPKPSKK